MKLIRPKPETGPENEAETQSRADTQPSTFSQSYSLHLL